MNCHSCGAPMKFDHEKIYFSCEYCTSLFFPEESLDGIRATDEETNLSCPVCALPLVIAYAGKTRLFNCQKCRGVLVEQAIFLPLIHYIRSKSKGPPIHPPPLRLEELKRKVFCPRCRNPMDTHPYGGPGNIVIDNCPRCQLNWLDHNELHRITRSPDRTMDEIYRQIGQEKLFGAQKHKGS